jgi:hypothetical protein
MLLPYALEWLEGGIALGVKFASLGPKFILDLLKYRVADEKGV